MFIQNNALLGKLIRYPKQFKNIQNVPKRLLSCLHSSAQNAQTFQNNDFLVPMWMKSSKILINKRYPSCSEMYSTVKEYSEYSKTIILLLLSALNSSQNFKLKIFLLLCTCTIKTVQEYWKIPKRSIFTVNQINNKIFPNNGSAKHSKIYKEMIFSVSPGALNSSKQLPPGRQESRHNKGNLPLGEHQEDI